MIRNSVRIVSFAISIKKDMHFFLQKREHSYKCEKEEKRVKGRRVREGNGERKRDRSRSTEKMDGERQKTGRRGGNAN